MMLLQGGTVMMLQGGTAVLLAALKTIGTQSETATPHARIR
jgi:hypothetical protein